MTNGEVAAFLPCGALHPVGTSKTRLRRSERKRESHFQLMGREYCSVTKVSFPPRAWGFFTLMPQIPTLKGSGSDAGRSSWRHEAEREDEERSGTGSVALLGAEAAADASPPLPALSSIHPCALPARWGCFAGSQLSSLPSASWIGHQRLLEKPAWGRRSIPCPPGCQPSAELGLSIPHLRLPAMPAPSAGQTVALPLGTTHGLPAHLGWSLTAWGRPHESCERLRRSFCARW